MMGQADAARIEVHVQHFARNRRGHHIDLRGRLAPRRNITSFYYTEIRIDKDYVFLDRMMIAVRYQCGQRGLRRAPRPVVV